MLGAFHGVKKILLPTAVAPLYMGQPYSDVDRSAPMSYWRPASGSKMPMY